MKEHQNNHIYTYEVHGVPGCHADIYQCFRGTSCSLQQCTLRIVAEGSFEITPIYKQAVIVIFKAT
jgi:hypothetical protein